MKGDFTRDTFDRRNHFTRVLWQQGRVQVDADENERTAILLHQLRSLARAVIGPHGGPDGAAGFAITTPPRANEFSISQGCYFVDGILCENEDTVGYRGQPDLPVPENEALPNSRFLVYLDVWERHLTCVEQPSIREVALGGADTATRARVVWQVKWYAGPLAVPATCADLPWPDLVSSWQPPNRGLLKARARAPGAVSDPCITSPDAQYRGAENQLYRVEVHNAAALDRDHPPTFKWSRENGSVVFPIARLAADAGTHTIKVQVIRLGRDARLDLAVGDWVEIVDDAYVLTNRASPLHQVVAIDRADLSVTVDGILDDAGTGSRPPLHPLLRRWDQKGDGLVGGAVPLVEAGGDRDGNWLPLEDGVQIQFQPTGPARGRVSTPYRTGDYWMIPARVATGDVEWPGGSASPEALPPHGVEHHYAPLAILDPTALGRPPLDCRCGFRLTQPCHAPAAPAAG